VDYEAGIVVSGFRNIMHRNYHIIAVSLPSDRTKQSLEKVEKED